MSISVRIDVKNFSISHAILCSIVVKMRKTTCKVNWMSQYDCRNIELDGQILRAILICHVLIPSTTLRNQRHQNHIPKAVMSCKSIP